MSTSEPITDPVEDLDRILGLVEELQQRVDSLDERPGSVPVSGESPEAGENRAIRGAQASLARQRARDVRPSLARLRERTIAMREQNERLLSERTVAPTDRRGPVGRDHRLSTFIASIAHELIGPETVDDTLDLVVAATRKAIPEASRVGVSLARAKGRIESRAPSDPVVRDLDRLQAQLDEGPCWDATRTQECVSTSDLTTAADRWPRFAVVAADRGPRSVAAFPLFGRRGPAGALNLYADVPHAFGEDALAAGVLFASHVSLALYGARRIAGLHDAVETRDVIGQAKGMLVERFGVDAEGAFDMLVRSSQEVNMKLVDVARWLVSERAGEPSAPDRDAGSACGADQGETEDLLDGS